MEDILFNALLYNSFAFQLKLKYACKIVQLLKKIKYIAHLILVKVLRRNVLQKYL